VASCGGSTGSDKELLVGVFSDSPVGGLTFVTQSTSGVTNADGVFSYREGETISFSIGSLALPLAIASEMVTPLDMAATDDVNDPSVVNIARLLQSLDGDGNPENGIIISENTANVFTDPVIYDATDDSAVDAAVSEVYGQDRAAVSADQAVSHFVDTLSAHAASDGSIDQLNYIVGADGTFEGESLFVGQDNFSLTVDGEVHTGDVAVNQGVYQLSGAQDTWFVSVDETAESKLACIEKAPTAVADCEDGLYHVFTDEEQAMAFNAPADTSRAETVVEENPGGTEDLGIGAANEAVTPEIETDPVAGPVDGNAATDTAPGAGDSTATESNSAADANSVTEVPAAPAQGMPELSLEELFPSCTAGTVDDNGDGYGWENNQSCLIVVDGAIVAEGLSNGAVEPAAPAPAPAPAPAAPAPAPVAPAQAPVTPAPVSTPPPAAVVETPAAAVDNTSGNAGPAPTVVQPSDITDIIVLTGQSNAAGVQTDFDATLDTGHERLFAYNENGQWLPAVLDQYWDANLPSNFASAAQGRKPFNNLAFQIGKSLTEKTDRVVGIILITAPGEGISHWDYNSAFYTQIRDKVAQALNGLPQKNAVDAMIWMQGETDWLAEGTADPGATGFASIDSDFYRNYYPNKLKQLVGNLRSEWWYGAGAQFICGETKRTALNHHLMALNNDGDNRTACAQASDLPTRASDPYNNHYSASSLRTLGGRVADLYLAGGS